MPYTVYCYQHTDLLLLLPPCFCYFLLSTIRSGRRLTRFPETEVESSPGQYSLPQHQAPMQAVSYTHLDVYKRQV